MTGNKFISQEKTIFGHPPGLFVLFFTELWERFSYYGMRALFTLFLAPLILGNKEKITIRVIIASIIIVIGVVFVTLKI